MEEYPAIWCENSCDYDDFLPQQDYQAPKHGERRNPLILERITLIKTLEVSLDRTFPSKVLNMIFTLDSRNTTARRRAGSS